MSIVGIKQYSKTAKSYQITLPAGGSWTDAVNIFGFAGSSVHAISPDIDLEYAFSVDGITFSRTIYDFFRDWMPRVVNFPATYVRFRAPSWSGAAGKQLQLYCTERSQIEVGDLWPVGTFYKQVFPKAEPTMGYNATGAPTIHTPPFAYNASGSVLNFTQLSRPISYFLDFHTAKQITQILGADRLLLRNVGTSVAFQISNHQLSAASINAFFTDLVTAPAAATINVQGNPGAATCTPSIATSKGYTVIV